MPDEDLQEVSKAVQEAAKFGEKALESADKLGGVPARVVRGGLSQTVMGTCG